MARLRVPLCIEAHNTAKKESSGSFTAVQPVAGAAISGVNRVTAAAANFYTAETGGSPVGSPVTDEFGNIPYWMEEGAWTITASGGTPSISPTNFAWDAVSGRGVSLYAPGSIKAAAIEASAITAEKVANATLTSAKFASGVLFGTWTAPESTTAAIQTSSIEARVELNSGIVRFRGKFTAKEALTAEKKLFTLPSALRPSAERYTIILNASFGQAARLTIPTSGVVNYVGVEATVGSVISFEGTTYVL